MHMRLSCPILSSLLPSEEIDVSKLLHLLDITTKRNLLVVEEDPALLLADKCDVMTIHQLADVQTGNKLPLQRGMEWTA